MTSPLDKQVAGNHYKSLPIQPVQYIYANKLGYFEGNVVKYVTRWKDKNGVADLEKAKHYIELLIELHTQEQVQKKEAALASSEISNLQLQEGFPYNIPGNPLSSFPSIRK